MGNIHLVTGNRIGKTTSALGVALRASGHDKEVVVVQFMKGRKDLGEYKAQSKIKDYKVYQFGSKDFVNLKKPSEKDKQLAKKGLEFVREIKRWPQVLVLDEICLAASINLLEVKDIIGVLKKIPKKTEVYLTGRNAPAGLKREADYVTIVITAKIPKNIECKKGINY